MNRGNHPPHRIDSRRVRRAHQINWCARRTLPMHDYKRSAGFTYVEVLVATFILAVCLLPALNALTTGIQGSAIHTSHAEDAYLLRAKMEEVLATSFTDLETAATAAAGPGNITSYSDTVPHADGRTVTRNVYLAAYDGDNADSDDDPYTGADPDLLWVRVAIPDTLHVLETLTLR